jgi:peptide/nickel transport system permease protein
MSRAALGCWGLVALLATAAGADFLASDLPLACRIEGRFFLFPNVHRPAELEGSDNQTLQSRVGARGGWVLLPPVAYGPHQHHPGGLTSVLASPSRTHLLGTDDRGRDVAARLIHGSRVAVMVGAVAVFGVLSFGIAVGIGAALHPHVNRVFSRLIEVGMTFPAFFLLLTIQGMAERGSVLEVALVVALTQWPEVARLVRVEALRTLQSAHVEAARLLGATPLRVAVVHVLPFAAAPAVTWAAFGLAQAVLYESALSFLGFGVPPPTPSWGELLAEAQSNDFRLWLWLPPSIAIAASVSSCQFVADWLRERHELVSKKR